MNSKYLSVKSWFLTHQPSLWGEAVLIVLFSGIAIMLMWEQVE